MSKKSEDKVVARNEPIQINANISALIKKIKPEQIAPTVHSNHAQFIVTGNEIIIDLYHASPDLTAQNLQLSHVVRIDLPLTIGKGFVEALANTIAQYERDHDVSLPNSRQKDESDLINIWTE